MTLLGDVVRHGPARRLGTWAAMAMVVSEVMGVGIFLAPAAMTRALGSVWASLLVWIGVATLTAAGALCYTELATRLPRAGGTYVFLREAFGLRCAFVYGWMMLLLIDPGIVAALGMGMAKYLIETLGGPSHLLVTLAIACIVGFGLLTLLGIHASARIMQWTAAVKVLVVGVLVVAGVSRFGYSGSVGELPGFTSRAIDVEAIATALVAAFFAFGGWWEVGRMSEEVMTPHRTIPRALLGGVALVAALYALVTIAFMLVTAAPTEASDEAFVRAVGSAVFGEAASRVLPAMVVVAVSGALAAVLLRAPRGYLAMARDGVFPRRLARFDDERGTYPGATLVQVSLACALVLVGTFDEILGYFVPTALFFVGLAAAAVLRLPRPDGRSGVFRMPWYPVPVGVFLLAMGAALVLFAVGHPRQMLVGAIVVALAMALSRFAIQPSGAEDRLTPAAGQRAEASW